ncbi:hypothetical protein Q4485_02935 [Granulosicoccaceae sp. 1_MG-2023]|nr:hypothetical protein [Granulosicoccaceae sp. 1_MG-2023]
MHLPFPSNQSCSEQYSLNQPGERMTQVSKNTNLNELPDEALLRMTQIIGDTHTQPIIPIGRSAWLAGVKEGRFPQPVKIGGSGLNFWRVGDIRALLAGLE